MQFRRLHDQWNSIFLKTLHFWKRFQNDPGSDNELDRRVTASKPMRLLMKLRPCKQELVPKITSFSWH